MFALLLTRRESLRRGAEFSFSFYLMPVSRRSLAESGRPGCFAAREARRCVGFCVVCRCSEISPVELRHDWNGREVDIFETDSTHNFDLGVGSRWLAGRMGLQEQFCSMSLMHSFRKARLFSIVSRL